MFIINILQLYTTTLFLEYDKPYTDKTYILICLKGRKESLIFSKIEDINLDKHNEKCSIYSVCMRIKDPFNLHKNSAFFYKEKKSYLLDFIKDNDLLFFQVKIPKSFLLENLTFKMFYWDDLTNFKYETKIEYLKDLLERREVVFDFRFDRGSNDIVDRKL